MSVNPRITSMTSSAGRYPKPVRPPRPFARKSARRRSYSSTAVLIDMVASSVICSGDFVRVLRHLGLFAESAFGGPKDHIADKGNGCEEHNDSVHGRQVQSTVGA